MRALTDTEIRARGVRALIEALGDVQAEKFIALIQARAVRLHEMAPDTLA